MASTCAKQRINISALVDEELDGFLLSEVDAHLSLCSECTEQLANLREFNLHWKASFSLPLSAIPDLWINLKEKLPGLCELTQAELSAYLDGELTSVTHSTISTHLNNCGDCQNKLRKLSSVNQMMARSLELSPLAMVDLWTGIKTQLNKNCLLIRQEISAFLDQELVNIRHRKVAQHILECRFCSKQIIRFTRLGELLKQSYKASNADNIDLLPGLRNRLKVIPFPRSEQIVEAPKSSPDRIVPSIVVLSILLLISILLVFCPSWFETKISAEEYLVHQALSQLTSDQPSSCLLQQ